MTRFSSCLGNGAGSSANKKIFIFHGFLVTKKIVAVTVFMDDIVTIVLKKIIIILYINSMFKFLQVDTFIYLFILNSENKQN